MTKENQVPENQVTKENQVPENQVTENQVTENQVTVTENQVTDRTYPIMTQLQLQISNHESQSTLIQRLVRSVSHPNRF